MREYELFRRYLDALDIEHRLLDRAELEAQIGSGFYRAGIQVADGALLQPAALLRGLAGSLPANLRLCEQSPVLEISEAIRSGYVCARPR